MIYVHSVMTDGIIFWGNSHFSIKIFKLQKKLVRIMTNLGPKDSCRGLFKKMKILPFYSQYIYFMLIHIINNMQWYPMNKDIHNYNTRNNANLHPRNINLTKFQKGAHDMGTGLYNHLLTNIKGLGSDLKLLRSALKGFLHSNFFLYVRGVF
jgi:hypothetical protein